MARGSLKEMERRRKALERMCEIAASRGGECLSAEYVNTITRLAWRCGVGHEWAIRPNAVQQGNWCPKCARTGASIGERISRSVLERMFEASFPKTLPSWLVGAKGRRLELDGYSERLGIAFEYNGIQHYQQIGFFSRARVVEQQERDAVKVRSCRQQGVTLITIPTFSNTANLSGCIDQIEASVLSSGLRVPEKWRRPASLPADNGLSRVIEPNRLARLNAKAAEHGGALLSTTAFSAQDKLRWGCSRGHEFALDQYKVLAGRWCPLCKGWHKTVADMQAMAAEKGGRFLSIRFEGVSKRHRWCCADGHVWDATPSAISGGNWCRLCANKRIGDATRRRHEANRRRKTASPAGPET